MKPKRVGGEFRVNKTSEHDQVRHNTIALDNGKFAVIYSSGDTYPDSGPALRTFKTLAQIFNGDGSKSGAEIEVYSGSGFDQQSSSVKALFGGGVFVDVINRGLFGFDAGGARADLSNVRSNDTATGTTLAELKDGRFVRVFSQNAVNDNGDSVPTIRGQLEDRDGNILGKSFRVDTPEATINSVWPEDPKVIVLEDGRFVVTYEDGVENSITDYHSDISAQIFDPREAGIVLHGSPADDWFEGSRFDDQISGSVGDDRIFGRGGNDRLSGGSGEDRLLAGNGKDIVSGNNGADYLSGGHGNDILRGHKGADKLVGGRGDDKLIGGAGADQMRGGGGEDLFVFRDVSQSGPGAKARDVILDFQNGFGLPPEQQVRDRIDLSAVDAVTGGADDAFSFIGTAAFSGTAGELRVVQSGGYTLVRGDVDGDGGLDFDIALKGLHNLSASDFIL